eukprot:GEMP01003608.1.p1 GENE.GEMP01003608.1~~GEMP01003608.1.p1  ORF type:complete len:1233 (+),score=308.00 GEMP01003608.1:120-3818(+)
MTASNYRRRRARAPLPMVDASMNDTVIDYMTAGKGPQEYNQAAVNFCVQQAMESWNSNPRKAAGELRCAYCLFRLLPERSVYHPFGHDILCASAYLLQHVGDIDDGLRMVDVALKVIPNVPATLFLKGYILLKRNAHAEAVRVLGTVCRFNPKYTPWVELVKAIFLLFYGNHDHAIASCGKVLVEYSYDIPLSLLAYWIRGHGYKYHPHGFFMNQAAEDYQVVLDHNLQWRTLLEKPFLPSRLGDIDDVLLMFLPWDFQPFGTTFSDYPLYSCPISWLHVLGLCLKAASRLKMRRLASVALKNLLYQQKSIKTRREEIEGRMRTIVTQQTKLEMEINDGHVIWGPAKPECEGLLPKYRRFWLEKPRCFPLRKDIPKPKKPRRPRPNHGDMELKWRPVGGGFAYGPRRVVVKPPSPPPYAADRSEHPCFMPNRRDSFPPPNRTPPLNENENGRCASPNRTQNETENGIGRCIVEQCEEVVRDVGANRGDYAKSASEYDSPTAGRRSNGTALLSPQSPAAASRTHANEDDNRLVKIGAIQLMQTELEVLQKKSMELETQRLPEEVLDAQVCQLHARTGSGIIEFMEEQPSLIPEKLEQKMSRAHTRRPESPQEHLAGYPSPNRAALLARIMELEQKIASANAPAVPNGLHDQAAPSPQERCVDDAVDSTAEQHQPALVHQAPGTGDREMARSIPASSASSTAVKAAVIGNVEVIVGKTVDAPVESADEHTVLHAQLVGSETIGACAGVAREETLVAHGPLVEASDPSSVYTTDDAVFSGDSGDNVAAHTPSTSPHNGVHSVEQPGPDAGVHRSLGFNVLHGWCRDDLVGSPSKLLDSARSEAVPYSWQASAHPLTPSFSSIPCATEHANEPSAAAHAGSRKIGADEIVRTASPHVTAGTPPHTNRPPEIASAWAKTAVGVPPAPSSSPAPVTAARAARQFEDNSSSAHVDKERGSAPGTHRANKVPCDTHSTAMSSSAVTSHVLGPCMGVAAPPLDALFRTHAQTSPRRTTRESLCLSVDRKNTSALLPTHDEKQDEQGDNCGDGANPLQAETIMGDEEIRSDRGTRNQEQWLANAVDKADMFLGKVGISLPTPISPRTRARHAQELEDLAAQEADTAADADEDERKRDGVGRGELRGYYQGVPLLDYMHKFGLEDVGVWFPALDRISKLSDGKLVTQQPCPFVQKTNFPAPHRARPPLYAQKTEKCRPWYRKNVSGAKSRDHSAPCTDRRVVA